MTIKSFRGILTDGGQDKIRVAGGKLEDGYRIVKLQTTMEQWGGETVESIMKIYKTSQKVIDALVDFTNADLLGSNVCSYNTSANVSGDQSVIIFDNEIFNQDIYVTNCTNSGGTGVKVNYYIELEQVKMSGPEAAAVNFRAALVHGGPNNP